MKHMKKLLIINNFKIFFFRITNTLCEDFDSLFSIVSKMSNCRQEVFWREWNP